ncbi:MAG: D-alanyl-D-alanine carboxypeptidase [Clostridia bacterium]|nr:D-alanyl-D-alanine carboxypeptidase [Clostridia bacterium]
MFQAKRTGISKLLILFTLIFTLLPINTAHAEALPLAAECAILMEATTGRVLYSHNCHARRYPASTTKILTALVVLENCRLDDVVTIPKEAVGVEGSSIYLSLGERLTVEELLYGLMLRSGNDAATALAIHTAGSIDAFAVLMNKKAEELGCMDSSFVNPSGLPSTQHYTTAYDLGLIACAAMANSTFATIVSTTKKVIPWEGREYDRVLINENKMLYNYDGANGIKTGYTKAAGRCLVSSATKNGMTLVAVVLNSQPMYADCSAMLDYGFENYRMTPLFDKKEYEGTLPVKDGFVPSVDYVINDEICYPLSDDDEISLTATVYDPHPRAPIEQGTPLGELTISLNRDILYTLPMVAADSIGQNTFAARLKVLFRLFFS